jgi:hypothetical protein
MTTISNKVRLYRYSDANAPVLSGTAGALIAILDACLVDGYDPKTINTLTVTGNNATAVISAGHTYEVGAVIRIAGATPAALNGDWRLASVTGTDAVFSVEGLGIAEGAATGTITALRAPAGWAKIYSDTNRAAYRSLDYADHNGMVLYIDDTGTTTARARGYESMSDIDTGVGPFPTDALLSGGCWWGKANNTTGSRNWALVADPRRLALVPCTQSSATLQFDAGTYAFGKLRGAHPSDVWAHVITSASTSAASYAVPSNESNGVQVSSSSGQYVYMPRGISGSAGAINSRMRVPAAHTSGGTNYVAVTLADPMWAEEARVSHESSPLGALRGVVCGPAHLYAGLSAAEGPGFSLVGAPGNGALVVRFGYAANAYVINLGTDGSWD